MNLLIPSDYPRSDVLAPERGRPPRPDRPCRSVEEAVRVLAQVHHGRVRLAVLDQLFRRAEPALP